MSKTAQSTSGAGIRLTGTPPVTQPADAGPNVLIFWAEMRMGAENVKAGGSLKGMECCGEERRDGVEREPRDLGCI